MGSKNTPGKFDCYAAVEPDEPMFILLARDPLAPFLTSIWSKMRYGDAYAARAVFAKMMDEIGRRYEAEPDIAKAEEAIDCAFTMFEWRKRNRP